jgi:hypothetical protein
MLNLLVHEITDRLYNAMNPEEIAATGCVITQKSAVLIGGGSPKSQIPSGSANQYKTMSGVSLLHRRGVYCVT